MTDTEQQVEAETDVEQNGHVDLPDLRAMRSEIGADKFEYFDIPGYHGKLVVKARRLEYKEVEKIGERVVKMREKHHPFATLHGHCDVIATATLGIYLRKDPEGHPEDLEPLSQGYPGLGDGEVFWDGLFTLVAKEGEQAPDTASGCVRRVINNDLAIAPLQILMAQWMGEVRGEDEEDFSFNF